MDLNGEVHKLFQRHLSYFEEHLTVQIRRLAVRNVPMYVCNYEDKVYRAVLAANQALDEYKYHLVGGAAGTVTPSKLYLHCFCSR